MSDQARSMQDMMMKMRQWFGWNGVVVLWSISEYGNKSKYYDNIENVIHYFGYNMSNINQIFTKLNDLEVIDIYTTLNSMFKSNRYDLIRQNVI